MANNGKMMKEEKWNKEEKEMKREMSKNFFPWEHIDFHEQIILQ